MYSKCGSLADAQRVFTKLRIRDVVAWDALMTGYAQMGKLKDVLYIFKKMNADGHRPSVISFVSVLNACSHAGMVYRAQTYFNAMIQEFGIIPTMEHYTCMIDLLGRAGQLDHALMAIEDKFPFHPDNVTWSTVLSACRKWGNVDLGKHAFQHVLQLNDKEDGAYTCMCNIYIDAKGSQCKNVEEAHLYKL